LAVDAFRRLAAGLGQGELPEASQALSSLAPALLVTAPYLAAFLTQHKDERTIRQVAARFPASRLLRDKSGRRAWFTDSAGPWGTGEPLLQGCLQALGRRDSLTVVSSLAQAPSGIPTCRNLPPIGHVALPGTPGHSLPVPPLLDLLELCEREGFDEIVMATPGPMGLAARAVSRLLGIRLVATHEVDLPAAVEAATGSSGLREIACAYLRFLLRGADAVLVPDAAAAGDLAAHGVEATRLRQLPRAIDRARFHAGKRLPGYWQQRLGLPHGCTLLHVGAIAATDGVPALLAAADELSRQEVPVNLVLVGDGEDRAQLAERWQSPRIRFVADLPEAELPRVYASADVLVAPGTADAAGHRLLEAHACGLPAVVDERSPLRHLVEAAGSGEVAAGRHGLGAALHALATDAARRAARARGAESAAAAAATWDEVVGVLWTAGELVAAPAAPRARAERPAKEDRTRRLA
ncbi:MAG TPA: glycosyltransferase, partial [Thermoanaerobaculia bacterium]|nr:glycosyltransferase [Thermoanaerobaculia bacterium]